MSPSAHLLRTLAAVAPGSTVVDLACGDGRHLVPLAQLGFDVLGVTTGDPAPARAALAESLGNDGRQRVVGECASIEDAAADWVVLAFGGAPNPGSLAEAARILRPGGWVWVEAKPEHAEAMGPAARTAGLVEAEEPGAADGRTHAIYRRPSAVA